jgi:RNA polymerase sigma factor for flagellar operon FliA
MQLKHDDAELIAQYLSTHDPQLREEIILRYVPLVHFVLGRLGISQSAGADYEDGVSQGLLGLIEAVDRYDPGFGTQFSTYATLRIRGKVIDHLRSLDWLSRGARQRARLVEEGIAYLCEKLHRMPSDDEIANHLNIDLSKVHQALVDGSRMIVSLDAVVITEGDEDASLHELLSDEDQPDPSEVIEEDELKLHLERALRSLPERERIILSLYYYEELTFKEIGAILDISESRVCQLHGRTMMTLRAMLSKNEQSVELERASGAGQVENRLSQAKVINAFPGTTQRQPG